MVVGKDVSNPSGELTRRTVELQEINGLLEEECIEKDRQLALCSEQIDSQLQQANDQLNSTTQQLHLVTDQLHQANDLISQLQSSSSSGPFGAALEEEREKRIALEKVCRHREDMIELAEKEMNKL